MTLLAYRPVYRALLTGMMALAVQLPAMHAAQATIYQCGPGQFSQQPCAGGRAYEPSRPIQQPSAEARQEADQVAQRQARLMQQMQADREKLERGPLPDAASLTLREDASRQDRNKNKKDKRKEAGKRKQKKSAEADASASGTFKALAPPAPRAPR